MSVVLLVQRLPLPGLLHRILLHGLKMILRLLLLPTVKRRLLLMRVLQMVFVGRLLGVLLYVGGQTNLLLLLLRHMPGSLLLVPWVLVVLLRAPLHLQLQMLRVLLVLL